MLLQCGCSLIKPHSGMNRMLSLSQGRAMPFSDGPDPGPFPGYTAAHSVCLCSFFLQERHAVPLFLSEPVQWSVVLLVRWHVRGEAQAEPPFTSNGHGLSRTEGLVFSVCCAEFTLRALPSVRPITLFLWSRTRLDF